MIALQAAEPGLFSEFKTHFEQMGEKSFDHTKKYWFNKLRLQYHLARELKPEKVHIENKLAEQTIAESILEEKIVPPSVGFKPRFKPGMAGKPAEPTSDVRDPAPQDSATITPEVNEAAATGDQHPAFVQEQAAMQSKADSMPRTTDNEPAEKPPVSPATKTAGFKPRFNAGMVKPKPAEAESEDERTAENEKPKTESENIETAGESTQKPPGFTPRFKAGVTKPKAPEPEAPKVEEAESEKPKAEGSAEAAPKPAGFKPRFNMKMVAPKEEVESEKLSVESYTKDATKTDDNKKEQQITEKSVENAPKPAGFKPRFNMKMVKPKPPEEE